MFSGISSERKVLICHYRVGWTDGVSLEIGKRIQVLKESGWTVSLLSGPNSSGADYVIDELDFNHPGIKKITTNCFTQLSDYSSDHDLLEDIHKNSQIIKRKLDMILDEFSPDFILLHNIFSHGRHIVCAKSFYDILSERKIPALATHHDFYWEREHLKNPVSPLVSEYLNKYVPPVLPGLRHAVINSISAKKLVNSRGISADIIPDTWDFHLSPWIIDEYNSDLLKSFSLKENDIYILQATRIVKRKGIELIPPIIKRLNEPQYLNLLKGRELYNGKIVPEDSQFVFLLAGYAEEEAASYRETIKQMMDRESIPYCFLQERISAERNFSGGIKKYSLFDTYPFADLISYPSQAEGWGNQFLEALFAKIPILIFEYPVFKKDIKIQGYKYISLGDEVHIDEKSGLIRIRQDQIDNICDQIVSTLLSSETNEELEFNYRLAKQNNSLQYLEKLLEWSMDHYEN